MKRNPPAAMLSNKKIISLLLTILLFNSFLVQSSISLFGQTYPLPFDLSQGNYSYSEWQPESTEGTYPQNFRFHTISTLDAVQNSEPDGDWILPYNLTSRARILGNGSDGFSFLNTSTAQTGTGFPSAAVLAINSAGRTNITVNWTGRTLASAPREYTLFLQYRIGNTGDFISLNSSYAMNSVSGHYENLSVKLPAAAEDASLVYLRWIYVYTGAAIGARPNLGIDNISVSSAPINTNAVALVIEAIEPSTLYNGIPFKVAIRTVDGNGTTSAVSQDTRIKLSLQSGSLSGTTEILMPSGEHYYEYSFNHSLTINSSRNFVIRAEAISGASLTSAQMPITITNAPANFIQEDFFGNIHLGMKIPQFKILAVSSNNEIQRNFSGYDATICVKGTNGEEYCFTSKFINGEAVFNNIQIDKAGEYDVLYSIPGLFPHNLSKLNIKPMPVVRELIVPRFIKGAGDINNTAQMRLPAYALIKFENLHPNTEYRFITGCRNIGVTIENDQGAGNCFHTDYTTGKVTYGSTKSQNLNQDGFYSVFKTSEIETTKTLWINTIPTTNDVFDENSEVYWIISLGTEKLGVIDRLHTVNTSKCLSFGTQAQAGKATGIFDSDSKLAAGSFVCLYSGNDDAMPITVAAVQTDGVALAQTDEQGNIIKNESPKYYADLENSNGAWAAFLPNRFLDENGNTISSELMYIKQLDFLGEEIRSWSDSDGIWAGVSTVNPSGGAKNPIEFKTPYLKLISPAAVENICNTGEYDIKWESRGIESLLLDITEQSGKILFSDRIPANKAAYNWKIPHGKFSMKELDFKLYSSEHTGTFKVSSIYISDKPNVIENTHSAVKCLGESIDLHVIADGDIFGYQWLKDGKEIAGASEPVLTLNNLDFSASASYQCKIIGSSICGDVFTDNIFIYIARETEITNQSVYVPALLGEEAVLTVEAHVNGAPPDFMPKIQWYRGGQKIVDTERISGAKSNILHIYNVQESDFGTDYYAEVYGLCNDALLRTDSMEIFKPNLLIHSTYEDTTVCEGSVVSFEIKVSAKYNFGKISYQWYSGNGKLNYNDHYQGSKTSKLVISNTNLDDATYYYVVVTFEPRNAAIMFAQVNLTVLEKPKIVLEPDSLYAGQAGRQLALGAGADGAEPIYYQWYKDGYPITGANWITYIKDNLSDSDAGEYRCKIWNECGDVWTRTCLVTVTYAQITGLGNTGEPAIFALNTPEPNPSRGQTKFKCSISGNSEIRINLFDQTGKIVSEIFGGMLQTGEYSFDIDFEKLDLPQGVYFIVMSANKELFYRKVIYFK